MMLSPTSSPRAIRAATAAAARDSPDLQRRALLGSSLMTQVDIETEKSRVIGELASRMKQPVPAFDKNKRGISSYHFVNLTQLIDVGIFRFDIM
jgi:hypothetical protein